MSATPLLGLTYLDESQAQKEVTINANMDILEANVIPRWGTLAARPAANAVPVNTLYYANDSIPAGIIYRSNGTTWDVFLGGNLASGYATLNGSLKVVQDPANAQTAAAASKIPLSGSDGRLDRLWMAGARNLHGIPDTTAANYKLGGVNVGVAFANQAYAINTLFALPILDMHGATINKIAFFVNALAGAGGLARIGIYTSVSENNIYPDALLFDAGAEIVDAGATAIREFTANQALTPNRLHWLAYLCGVAAPTIRSVTLGACFPVVGISNAYGTPRYFYQVAQAYGALPATFPAGATAQNSANAPGLAFTLSA